jgi:hypothetical protein
MIKSKVNTLLKAGLILYIFIDLSMCCKDECRTCVKCISYDSSNSLINESKECNPDTAFIRGFKDGFMLGASQKGYSSICFELPMECD